MDEELYAEKNEREWLEKVKYFEQVCPDCNKKGFIFVYSSLNPSKLITALFCKKCKGTGKVNWIDNIKNQGLSKPFFKKDDKWFVNNDEYVKLSGSRKY